tara:strand:- start:9333 stop:10280 length:948 start_codon:yes stop_codon:yes gene_type:complete
MKAIKLSLLLSLIVTLFGCQPEQRLEQGEGFIETVNGKIWYRVTGNGNGTPLLLLHGGPGFTSHPLNPMSELGSDRPIIFIDQLGSGRSDILKDTSLMTIENFVEHISQVKSGLGLNEFYLYGHSWGTMLAMDFYLKYPEGIKGIIFASPLLSTEMWSKDADKLIKELPDSVQQDIAIHTANKTYDSPEYQEAMGVYYTNYVARKTPWDANIDSTFSMANLEIYSFMWGPSEFKATGNLKDYNRLDEVKTISVPTLFICGEYDEAQPSTVQFYQSLVRNSRFEVIENSAHVLTHDNPEKHNQIVREFLMENDQKE